MSGLCANEPGVGTSASEPGLYAPWTGSVYLASGVEGPPWTVRNALRMSSADLYLVVSATALPAGEVMAR